MRHAHPHRLAPRLADIEPFHVMRILEAAKQLEAQGRDVIHLEVGEPDFATPPQIVEAGIAALRAGHTFYTGACGLSQLREAIAGFYQDRFGLSIDPRRIIVTPGASGALQLILALLVGRDDEVLLTDPGYPCNRHLVTLCEGRPVNIAVGADSRFQLLARHVEQHAGECTVATLVASPANPSGTVLELAEIAELAAVCRKKNIALIVDEIYQGLVYERAHETALTVAADAFIVNSFSKFFQMTGWRLGWLVAPEWAIPELEKLAQNLFLAAPTPAQYAALAAFGPDTLALLEARRAELDQRRRVLCKLLTDIGLTLPAPAQGAFYLWADCSAFTDNTETLAAHLLDTESIALTPGRDFGSNPLFMRLAYTQPVPRLLEAAERLRRSLARGCRS
ncbi:aminotransferase class I/II-fold pyridoxal phosphate-dependent enzyme [Chitinolyticbacter albus]|uniref:aminotransferase class I/II-fold pyridoxal phosphate-dependent enzyme n=1 Tax=Chitinolyticbacter albus TaxID=2961951 RepID=UPI002109BD63|nr:aminotransferase class I/II-fold pyridoxal phosphate-dependent enzyme [Chitinolyticbacter albus]